MQRTIARLRSGVLSRAAILALTALTILAAALRLKGFHQSLFGDELFTYDTVNRARLGSVLHQVHAVESSPPLYYLLAWGTGKLADPRAWIRLPSLLLGVATVPMIFVLGRRFAGNAPALTAAALVALGPFAVFFSTEARAYSTLVFLTTLSTIALLTALRSGQRRWWAAFVLASTAALYTHYTAVFPLAGQAGWALWTQRERLRPVLLSYGAMALAYVPWLFEIRKNGAEAAIAGSYRLTAGSSLTAPVRVLWGHPIQSLGQLPGTGALRDTRGRKCARRCRRDASRVPSRCVGRRPPLRISRARVGGDSCRSGTRRSARLRSRGRR